ncbi:MBL fold metallo-hydrolase [Chloroflexi bacterium TSY]|nr:MBL fold metallo-hydrolase [Chloroflexi bacterium TSY]
MNFLKKSVPIIVALCVLTVLTVASAQAQDGQLQPVSTPIEKAVMGVGGEEALLNLNGYTISASGTRWIHDEGFEPGSSADLTGPFQWQISGDIANGNLRVDHTFGSGDNARLLSEIIADDVGILDGRNSNFGPPATNPMLSDRLTSALKHQRLLNPHLILLDILANPESAVATGEVLHDGSVHHVLTVEDSVAPIMLYINAGSGRIAKVSTMEADALRRDISVEVFYYSWQPVGGGLFFPAEVYVAYDGDIVHKEIRSAVAINPELDSALFAIPDDVSPVYDETLAARGEAMHQYLQSFAARGFPRDGFQLNVSATELGAGVYHVTGGSHHSLAVEQDDSIVIVEAPLDEMRSQAVMTWVAENFPDKPISHAIVSHHHVDHSAGLREYAAAGVTAVVHESAAPSFAEFFQTSSTIVPDTMEESPVTASIESVPADGSLIVGDGPNAVAIYPIDNGHARDLVIAHIPDAGVVFVVDIYSPNPNAQGLPPGGLLLNNRISELGLDVTTIAGGHGGTIEFEAFTALAGAQ